MSPAALPDLRDTLPEAICAVPVARFISPLDTCAEADRRDIEPLFAAVDPPETTPTSPPIPCSLLPAFTTTLPPLLAIESPAEIVTEPPF